MNNNKHVFSELVTDIKNPEHLIAYAFYKHKKHNLALSLEQQGRTKEEIGISLEHEKQNTLSNPVALQGYKDDAAVYISALIEGATKRVKEEYEEQRSKDRKAITAEAKQMQAQWLKKVDAQRVADAKTKT